MRSLLISIILTLSYRAATAQGALEITIKNIRKVTGTVMVGLFDSDKNFPKRAVLGKVITLSGDSVTVEFTDLEPGSYAISVIHDENNNSKLDNGIFGIPKEGFAFGNNAMGMFGPPSFKDASIVIMEGHPVKQVLLLKYF